MRDDKVRRFFKALAHKTRYDIVETLGTVGETSVSKLGVCLNVTQPLMSWHVRVLRNAGVIATHRVGRQVFCSVDVEGILAAQSTFSELVSHSPAAAPIVAAKAVRRTARSTRARA